MVIKVGRNEYAINLCNYLRFNYIRRPCRGIRFILYLGLFSIAKWDEGE